MPTGNDNGAPGTEVQVFGKVTVAKFAEMATAIPIEDGNGAERILEQILSAETWDDLDTPWESSKAEQLAGRILRLDRAERRPSDFRDGLGIFLVLHCVDVKSGEVVVVITSAVAVIGQVVRAYFLKALPLYIEFIVAARATEAGYKPHHLKIHGSAATQAAQADDSQVA